MENNFVGGALRWNFVHHHHAALVFVLGFEGKSGFGNWAVWVCKILRHA